VLPDESQSEPVTQPPDESGKAEQQQEQFDEIREGWRREVNTVRRSWRWARGSGDLREFIHGGAFSDLTDAIKQRSIENGRKQKELKAAAAAKRAART
jgi:hypothetical protein